MDHHYYTFSSVFFYTNRDALLLNGRFNNLVYGSYAPGAPNVFIDDAQWKNCGSGRSDITSRVEEKRARNLKHSRVRKLLFVVAESGGKMVLTNQALP